MQLHLESPDDMRRLALAVQPLLRTGDLIVLSGEIGAGKTVFVRELARGMGIEDRVTSPTFTLLHTYEGPIRLHHLDLYRINGPSEVIDLDLPECLDDVAVTAIEWGERALSALPQDFLWIKIAYAGPEQRDVELATVGPSWTERTDAVEGLELT